MKKTINIHQFLLYLIFVITLFDYKPLIASDINHDSKVGIDDAITALQVSAGIKSPLYLPTNFKWRGVWNSNNVEYLVNDVVFFDGSSFICILYHFSNENRLPTNTALWEMLTQKGDRGIQGEKGEKGEKGDIGPQGVCGIDFTKNITILEIDKVKDHNPDFIDVDISSLGIPEDVNSLYLEIHMWYHLPNNYESGAFGLDICSSDCSYSIRHAHTLYPSASVKSESLIRMTKYVWLPMPPDNIIKYFTYGVEIADPDWVETWRVSIAIKGWIK